MKNTSKEKNKKKIKSFIYLDEYKMYSISSQIFEGLTEYIINHSENAKQGLERQEGPIGSGKVLADIISRESSTEERKFLHDYSYNLFEEKLLEDRNVLQIGVDNFAEMIECLDEYEFIKIKGRMLFSDIRLIGETIDNFNQLGEALTYIINFQDIDQVKKEDSQSLSHTRNRNDKAFTKQANARRLNALAARAKEAGLAMDQDFLDKIKFVLNYGYKEQLEAKVYFLEDSGNNYYSFSSPLKRNYLKEDEHLIVSKFSRYSEKEFVIFGMITQSKENQSGVPVEQNTNSQDFKHIKQAISQLISGILHVEEQFLGKVENEVLIDPIAIYREI